MELGRCSRCRELKPAEAFAMRSDKPYRRRWCTDCLNAWQRQRRAIRKAGEWTRHGAKGGRGGRRRGDWLRHMAPAAKARHIRDAKLKALYGISLVQ
jgi:hypothetical protein